MEELTFKLITSRNKSNELVPLRVTGVDKKGKEYDIGEVKNSFIIFENEEVLKKPLQIIINKPFKIIKP